MSWKKQWDVITTVAIWILSVLGTFLLPPPFNAQQLGQYVAGAKIGSFFIAIMVGLMLVPALKWKRKTHAIGWWLTAFISFVIGLVVFLTYQHLYEMWTCRYNSQRWVIGSAFTPHGSQFVAENSQRSTCEDWLMSHAGRVEEIWSKWSIVQRCDVLFFTYVFSLFFFTVTIISLVQAVACQKKRS
jgi:hypothetical protein